MRSTDVKQSQMSVKDSKHIKPPSGSKTDLNLKVSLHEISAKQEERDRKDPRKMRPESSPAKSVSSAANKNAVHGLEQPVWSSTQKAATLNRRTQHQDIRPTPDAEPQSLQKLLQLRKELSSFQLKPRPAMENVTVEWMDQKLQQLQEYNGSEGFIQLRLGSETVRYLGGLDFSPDNRSPETFGYLQFSHGGFYLGGISAGFPHGQGKELTKHGSLYVGGFKNGKKHGFGCLWTQSESEGVIYFEGDFAKGKKDGRGTYITQTGKVYRGFWRNDLQNGPGEELFENGEVFSGDFSQGIKQGFGELLTAKGKLFSGNWQLGLKSGSFSIYDLDTKSLTEKIYNRGMVVI